MSTSTASAARLSGGLEIDSALTISATRRRSVFGRKRDAHVPSGKVVPLAVLGRQRSTSLPQVRTMNEVGFIDPIYDTNVRIGLLTPAKSLMTAE